MRFNWLTLYYRYQNIDTYFGTCLLHTRRGRAAAADQEEEGHSEERLHPPRRRYLPHLSVERIGVDMSLSDRTELRGRCHSFHRVPAERGGGGRIVPAADQHSVGLSRRGVRDLQIILRVRQLRRWRLHRRGDDRGRGRAGLRPDLPDGPGIGLHHPHSRHVRRRQDQHHAPTRARFRRSTRCRKRPSRSRSRWTTG